MPDTYDLFPLRTNIISRQIEVWINRFGLNLSGAFLCGFDLGGQVGGLNLEEVKSFFHGRGYRQPCYSIVLFSQDDFPTPFKDRIAQINYGDLFDRFFADAYLHPPGDDWLSDWDVHAEQSEGDLPYPVKFSSRFKTNLLDPGNGILIRQQEVYQQPEPSLENNPIYKIEIRQDKGLDVYFDSEKSLVTGRPSEFLLALIEHQSQKVDFRFFSNKGEGGQPDYESGLYEEDLYESNDTNFKPYQAHLDELYIKRDFAIEEGNRAQTDSVISEIAKFETDIVKKTLSGFVDDDGQITRGRKKLKREFEKEINRLVKQKANLLKQLKPNTKAHFDESLNTGTKLSYSPKHPIDWKIIQ
jgi:hypothetical protein